MILIVLTVAVIALMIAVLAIFLLMIGSLLNRTANNLDDGLKRALLTFLWVASHDRPGSGGQSPPRVRSAMAISDSGLW
jgi:hypothetical protein